MECTLQTTLNYANRALLDLHRGASLTPQQKEWRPWAAVRPLTWLALLERHCLLALAVLSGGANNLVAPSSLVFDHLTQPGVADLLTLSLRHTAREAAPERRQALYALLCEACDALARVLTAPEAVRPAGRVHDGSARGGAGGAGGGGGAGGSAAAGQQQWPSLQQQKVQPQKARVGGGSAAAGSGAGGAGGGGRDEDGEELGMFLRRAVALLFTIAINVRSPPLQQQQQAPQHPYQQHQMQQQRLQRGFLLPQEQRLQSYQHMMQPPPPPQAPAPQPPASPAASCWRVARAAVGSLGPPNAGGARAPSGAAASSGSARGGLAAYLPLLPYTLRFMLSSLNALHSRSPALFSEPSLLGPEFCKALQRGGDKPLRLFRRAVAPPPGMAWARDRNKGVNVEEVRELPPLRGPGAAAADYAAARGQLRKVGVVACGAAAAGWRFGWRRSRLMINMLFSK